MGKKGRRDIEAARPAVRVSWEIALLIAAVTLLAYWPTLHNGFVNWDDETTLINNISFRGLTWTPHEDKVLSG